MKNIDLTFGIPAYNAEKYITELINCFKKSNVMNYEVIIIDDGSTDKTCEICESINDKNIKFVHKDNEGVSSTRNKIIDIARGEWITFIDADDLIDFDKYEKIFKKIKNSDCDYYFGIRNNIKRFNTRTNQLPYLIENELINSPIDKFYKKDILDKNNIRFDSRFSLGEDLLFNLFYIKVAKKIEFYYSDNMYIVRNINNNSLTHKYREDKFDELMQVNLMCKDLVKGTNNLKALEYIRVKNCISCIKDFYIFAEISDNNNKIKMMKKYSKRKYLFLNTLKTTIIYNAWYILPNCFIKLMIKKIIIN